METETPFTQLPAEAGFSTNFTMTHDKIGTQQFVFRGALSSSWSEVLVDIRNFIEHQTKNGWRFNIPQGAPPPKSAPVSPDNPPSAQPQETIIQSGAVPAAPDGKTWMTMSISKVVVTPEPGDLVTIGFFGAGHKYADIKANKWKIERAAGMMKHVTSHDMRKPAELSLPCTVYFVNGKEKEGKPGEYWKDIYHVRPDSF